MLQEGRAHAQTAPCSALEFRAATFFGHEQIRDLALNSCGHDRPSSASACGRATFGTSYLACDIDQVDRDARSKFGLVRVRVPAV